MTMKTKLWVGGIPYSMTNQELAELFAGHCTPLSAKIITDKWTGRSRGFGFIEVESEGEGIYAASVFDELEYGGRHLSVKVVK